MKTWVDWIVVKLSLKVGPEICPLRAILCTKMNPIMKTGLHEHVEILSKVDVINDEFHDLIADLSLSNEKEYYLRLYSSKTSKINAYAYLSDLGIHDLYRGQLRLNAEGIKGLLIENGSDISLKNLIKDMEKLNLYESCVIVRQCPIILSERLLVKFEKIIHELPAIKLYKSMTFKGSAREGLELSNITFESYLGIPENLSSFLYGKSSRLFRIQADALHELDSGKNVLLTAGTGTGKTEVGFLYFIKKALEDGPGIGLFIYPTNALLKNQFDRACRIANWFNDIVAERIKGAKIKLLEVCKLYGPALKRKEAKSSRVYEKICELINEKAAIFLMTNPQFCINLLDKWKKYFWNIPVYLVVFDEFQFYNTRSLLALAHFVIKKLREIKEAETRFLICSATVCNPEEVKRDLKVLLGGEFVNLTSPRRQGEKTVYLLYLKDDVDREELAAEIIKKLANVAKSCNQPLDKTLCYVLNRNACDRIYFYLPSDVRKYVKRHYSDLSSYEREKIEAKFIGGEVRCLVTTRTLEVGIDIGDVSRIIHVDVPPSIADIAQREGRMGRSGQECESIFLISSELERKIIEDYLRKLDLGELSEAQSIGGRVQLNVDSRIAGLIRSISDKKKRGRYMDPFDKSIVKGFRRSIYGRLIKDDQPDLWKIRVADRKRSELAERELRLYDVVVRYQKGFIHSISRDKKYEVVGFIRDNRGNNLIMLQKYNGIADIAITYFNDDFMKIKRKEESLDDYYYKSELFLVKRDPLSIVRYRIISGKSNGECKLYKIDEIDLWNEEHHVYRDIYEGFLFKLSLPITLRYSSLYLYSHYVVHILLNKLAEKLNVRYSEFFDFIRIPSPEGIMAFEELLKSQAKEVEIVICDQSGLLADNIRKFYELSVETFNRIDGEKSHEMISRHMFPLCESYNCPVTIRYAYALNENLDWKIIGIILKTLSNELESRLYGR